MANLSNINNFFVVEQTTGYVGIGNTDPAFPLEVKFASAELALNATGGSIYRVISTASDEFIINKNGVGDRLTISSGGDATFTGTVKSTTFLIGNTTAQGIGASLGDINGIELGPGYLTLARDDTADAKQLVFEKNDVEHAAFITTSDGLTIDSAERIFLDSSTDGDVRFLDDGTQYGQIFVVASNMYLRPNGVDADLYIQGNDNGSYINMLYFNTSDNGAATFSGTVTTSDVYGTSSLRTAALGGIHYVDASSSLLFRTSGSFTERMRIDSSGQVEMLHSLVMNKTDGSYIKFEYNSATRGYLGSERQILSGGSEANMALGATGDLAFATGGSLTERMRISSSGDVQARRPRSNTAGEVALSLQPTDTVAHYGWRIDQTSNNLNLDYVNTPLNIMSYSTTGNVGIGQTPYSYARLLTEGSDNTSSNYAFIAYNQNTDAILACRNDGQVTIPTGNVGIGITVPTTSYQKVLHVHEPSGSANIHITNNTTGSTASDGCDLIAYGSDFYIWNREVGSIFLGTSATTRLTIEGDGTIRAKTGSIVVDTIGQGIYLGGTAVENKLDDYEEGTWTPEASTSNSDTTTSYTAQMGTYTKVGRLVTVMFDITVNVTGTNSGIAFLRGLPFTVGSSVAYGGSMAGYSCVQWRSSALVAASTTGKQLKGFAQQGSSYLYVAYNNSGSAGFGGASGAQWNSGSSLRTTGYCIYYVN